MRHGHRFYPLLFGRGAWNGRGVYTEVRADDGAAVLTPDGKVRYWGRIDNTYAAIGVRRNATFGTP